MLLTGSWFVWIVPRQMDKDGYFKYATDSVYIVNHPQYYKNGKYYASNDTVAWLLTLCRIQLMVNI